MVVSRLLPAPKRRMVGPFVFLDHLAPVTLPPGAGFDVRPHPQIGLSTVTYFLAGENVHRDSLGTVQTNRPFDVNLMTAGRGVVHSERAAPAAAARQVRNAIGATRRGRFPRGFRPFRHSPNAHRGRSGTCSSW